MISGEKADDLPAFENWLLASSLLGSADYDAQLRAIRGLLHVHRHADEALKKEIEDLDAFARSASTSASDRAVDEWVDCLHQSVFQDAAHSMAAVGMLAPFIESVFRHAFFGMRDLLTRKGLAPSSHKRWTLPEDRRWDCRYASPGRKDLVAGIIELADATGLAVDMPSDLSKTLAALFGYRNKMFHLGFEWPDGERDTFAHRIASEGWSPGWFSQATSDGKPWVFYMSDAFVQHCLDRVDSIFSGFGAFVRRAG
jgi:hypothetical protein